MLRLFRELQSTFELGVLFITHDLGVVAQIGDNVAVMYCGQIIESGPVREVLQYPAHPYTRSLLNCLPRLEPQYRQNLPRVIPGTVSPYIKGKSGCRFYGRCAEAMVECETTNVPIRHVDSSHSSRCLLTRSGDRARND